MSIPALCALTVMQVAVGAATINFAGCQSPSWACRNGSPDDVTYTCSVHETESTINIKDYHLSQNSVTVRNCKHIKVVMDCVSLQTSSRLNHFIVKDSDKLEFATTGHGTPSQLPPQLTIENVKEVVSLPRNFFKSPMTSDEEKCLGTFPSKSLYIRNSKINAIKERSIYNAAGMQKIVFENVTIENIEKQAINIVMVGSDAVFMIRTCHIDNLKTNSVIVETNMATITDNTFGDILLYGINITADNIDLIRNSFDKIEESGFSLVGTAINITDNDIDTLASNALTDIKCSRRTVGKQYFNFSNNTIRNIKPYSLWFDYASCKNYNSSVIVKNNKMQCKCQDMSFLTTTSSSRQELNNLILDLNNNNTCLSTPCLLPIEMVKVLVESHICQLNLDMQVTCMLYYDKKPNVTEATEKEEEGDVTEPTATFYLIRQASVPNGSASAAMTAIDKDELLRDTHLNITQRTMIRVVFDASKDFADMLRSTSAAHKRHSDSPSHTDRAGSVGQCIGRNCRNATFDRQKALDFYKYVYAQLRPPRPIVNNNTSTTN